MHISIRNGEIFAYIKYVGRSSSPSLVEGGVGVGMFQGIPAFAGMTAQAPLMPLSPYALMPNFYYLCALF